MATKREAETVADQLRRAVAASGVTAYRLALMSGLPESTVSRLKHGVTPTLHTAECLARALGYRLVLKKGGRKRPTKGRRG